MRLKWFQVTEFQSVHDSGRIDVGEITCLVGKNEAGKSALLKALYRLNPFVNSDGSFDVTIDYPRMNVEDYRHDVERRKRQIATPIRACYQLDEDEIDDISEIFGEESWTGDRELTVTKSYENKRLLSLNISTEKALNHLLTSAGLAPPILEALKSVPRKADALLTALKGQEQTSQVSELVGLLTKILSRGVFGYAYDTVLTEREPKYLYFDEYYQMTGHENIEALIQRKSSQTLKSSDHPLLGLINLSRLNLTELTNPSSTIDLKGRLQGASNHLTKQILKYWSQNKHLRMEFDVRPARPGDPAGMTAGTNIWGGVYDTRHQVTTELGSRSRGFVWFFSFLAWYSDVKRNEEPLILLLDEPGLTLHAKAQGDLLRYFEIELKGNNQLLYSTHSPFMIDSEHFDRVRVVQDKSIDSDDLDPTSGTQVLTDIFAASEDSLFPLQGALGYEIHQTLFVGPFSLVVEGVADLLYLQTMSALLAVEGGVPLDPRWTITPVGGASKVPTFVALLGAQRNMTIATLIDAQASDQQKIDGLYREKLLKKANVLTFADFCQQAEADVEDMFSVDLYLDLVNEEFSKDLLKPVEMAYLKSRSPRILKRLEEYFVENPLKTGSFSHYRPARYLAEHSSSFASKISADTKARFEAAFKTLNKLLPM